MKLFKRKMEERAQPEKVSESDTIGAELLRALLGNSDITREQALEIPVVSAAIDKISKTIVSLPIKLYQKKGEETKEITDDVRLKLLNNDTGDTLTSSQFWYAMLADYYLGKGGFAYINKFYTEFKGLHHIENEYIGFMTNVNPIYKDYDILVNGEVYSKYSFLKLVTSCLSNLLAFCTEISICFSAPFEFKKSRDIFIISFPFQFITSLFLSVTVATTVASKFSLYARFLNFSTFSLATTTAIRS